MFNEKIMKEAEKYSIEYYKHGRVPVWHDEFDKDEIDEALAAKKAAEEANK